MAEYYCRLNQNASGVVTNPAVWSSTPGGPSAATAPTSSDRMHFVRSCTVTGMESRYAGSVVVPEGVEVTLVCNRNVDFGAGTIDIDGTLRLSGQGRWRMLQSQKTIGRNGILWCDSGDLWIANHSDPGLDSLDASPTSVIRASNGLIIMLSGTPSEPLVIPVLTWEGTVELSSFISEGPSGIEFALGTHVFRNLQIHHPRREATAGAMYVTSLADEIDVEGDFFLKQAPVYDIIFDWGDTRVCVAGDLNVPQTACKYRWSGRWGAVLYGTQDQTVNLSDSFVADITLDLKKDVGTVTLQRFNGRVEGQSERLVCRDFDEIALCGQYVDLTIDTVPGRSGIRVYHDRPGINVNNLTINSPESVVNFIETKNSTTYIRNDLRLNTGTEDRGGRIRFLFRDDSGVETGNSDKRNPWELRGFNPQEVAITGNGIDSVPLVIEKNNHSTYIPETANVVFAGYKGTILACLAHRLSTDADSELTFSRNRAYGAPSAVPGQSLAFEGSLHAMENRGTLRFVRQHSHVPPGAPAGLPDVYPTLTVSVLDNDGAILGEVLGETDPLESPWYDGTIRLRWNVGGPFGTGSIGETIRLLEYDYPIAPIEAFALEGPNDGSGNVAISFSSVWCAGARIEWGDGTSSEVRSETLDTARLQSSHTYSVFDREYTILVTSVNPEGKENTFAFTHFLSKMPPPEIVSYTIVPAGDESDELIFTFTCLYCLSIRVDWMDGTTSQIDFPDTGVQATELRHAFSRTTSAYTVRVTMSNPQNGNVTIPILFPVPEAKPATIEDIVLVGMNDGSGRVSLSFRGKRWFRGQITWGDGGTLSFDMRTIEELHFEGTHAYLHKNRLYNIRISVWNVHNVEYWQYCECFIYNEPVAVLAVNPAEGEYPLAVMAHTEGSSGTEYLVDWGDGTQSAGSLADNPQAEHTYFDAGDYLVILSVRYPTGISSTTGQNVHVTAPPSEGLLAVLNVEPTSGYAPLSVSARATGSSGTAFKFDWGDGSNTGFTTQRTAVHTYENAGLYPITLTVRENKATASTALGVVVQYAPPPSGHQPRLICADTEDGRSAGIARTLPSPFHLTLAQGTCYMFDTLELFCEMSENGRSLETGSALFLARIQHSGGVPILPEEVRSVAYTLWRLDDRDASVKTGITGHVDVPLAVHEVLLAEPVLDAHWTHDTQGYNFRHAPAGMRSAPDSGSEDADETHPLFPVAGRNYRLEYRLVMHAPEQPEVLLRYRVHVV